MHVCMLANCTALPVTITRILATYSYISIQIGLRCDSAVASIYHEGDLEIENCEILFTHEGRYVASYIVYALCMQCTVYIVHVYSVHCTYYMQCACVHTHRMYVVWLIILCVHMCRCLHIQGIYKWPPLWYFTGNPVTVLSIADYTDMYAHMHIAICSLNTLILKSIRKVLYYLLKLSSCW